MSAISGLMTVKPFSQGLRVAKRIPPGVDLTLPLEREFVEPLLKKMLVSYRDELMRCTGSPGTLSVSDIDDWWKEAATLVTEGHTDLFERIVHLVYTTPAVHQFTGLRVCDDGVWAILGKPFQERGSILFPLKNRSCMPENMSKAHNYRSHIAHHEALDLWREGVTNPRPRKARLIKE